jgi:large conductance mechanosensitive channel
MQRLREMLAHGGVAVLALVFALAYAAVTLASAVANEVVSVLSQAIYGEEGGFGGYFEFTVWGTDISYYAILQTSIVVALVAGLLFALWRSTRGSHRNCPECRSDVPKQASVCRYCTADLATNGD